MHNLDPPFPRPAERQGITTRRSFLRGVLGVAGAGVLGTGALAGCDLLGGGIGGGGAQAHPLDGFLLATVALGDRYDATLAAVPALAPALTSVRDAHRAHATALAAELGKPAPKAPADAAPAPVDRAEAVAALAAVEKSARDEAVAACLAGSARLAPLLGAIAAARASHLEVLR